MTKKNREYRKYMRTLKRLSTPHDSTRRLYRRRFARMLQWVRTESPSGELTIVGSFSLSGL